MLIGYATSYTQEQIEFKKHTKLDNLVAGNKGGFELPVYIGGIMTSDYDYEDADEKGPLYFGISPKFTLKNGWGRGVGLGTGIDFSPRRYVRANLLIDLDFLFTYSIEVNEKGTKFTPSMFTKFEFSKLLAKSGGEWIKEYYLSVNIIKFQFGKVAFEWGVTRGLFRDQFVPYFADRGIYYKLSYFIF